MYIETSDSAYKSSLFNAIVAPRPIGWISSLDEMGTPNLAPFSYFNGMSATPPMVMFACKGPADRPEKDTLANVRRTGEFVANLATYDLRDAMNMTSSTVPSGVDEFDLAGLVKLPSRLIKPHRVAASPVSMECRLLRVVDFPPDGPGERKSSVVFGRVLALHIDDASVDAKGRFDMLKARPLARLGGFTYLAVSDVFELPRPATD